MTTFVTSLLAPVLLAIAVTSMISTLLGTPVQPAEPVVVAASVSKIAVPTAGEVAMVSPIASVPTKRPMVVVTGIAMLDAVASAVQSKGEDGVAVNRGHECEEIETVVDSLAAMAVTRLRAGSEEQASEDERADCREFPDLRGCPFHRMH